MGGTTPFGLDCSGLTQLAYKLSGVQLLRDAGLQFEDRRFERVEPDKTFDEADFEPGDLVMFRKKPDGPSRMSAWRSATADFCIPPVKSGFISTPAIRRNIWNVTPVPCGSQRTPILRSRLRKIGCASIAFDSECFSLQIWNAIESAIRIICQPGAQYRAAASPSTAPNVFAPCRPA